VHRSEFERWDEPLPPVQVRPIRNDGFHGSKFNVTEVKPHRHRRDEMKQPEETKKPFAVQPREEPRSPMVFGAVVRRRQLWHGGLGALRLGLGLK